MKRVKASLSSSSLSISSISLSHRPAAQKERKDVIRGALLMLFLVVMTSFVYRSSSSIANVGFFAAIDAAAAAPILPQDGSIAVDNENNASRATPTDTDTVVAHSETNENLSENWPVNSQKQPPKDGMAVEATEAAIQLMETEAARRIKANEDFQCRAPMHASKQGQLGSSRRKARPSVAFLFLTGAKKNRNLLEDIWQEWFPPADDERYSLWVHTHARMKTVPLGPFLCQYAIPSVPSKHWWLLEAIIRLLTVAHRFSTASHFVFVSSTSLPIQSFDRVYEMITGASSADHDNEKEATPSSCLCLSSFAEGRRVWNITGPLVGVEATDQMKAEMWSSLSRPHVELILKNTETLTEWNNAARETAGVEDSNVGAPDEMFIPTLLKQFGAFERKELRTTHGVLTNSIQTGEHMGCCTHHISWHITKLTEHDKQTLTRKCSLVLGRPPFHPCAYKNILSKGFRKIQQEDYMFLRKVWHGAVFEEEDGEALTLREGLRRYGVLPGPTGA